MRIMHVIDSLGVGGAEQYAVQLVNALSTEGLLVEMGVCRGGLLERDVASGISIRRNGLRSGGYRVCRYTQNYLRVRALARLLCSSGVDIVHTHLSGSGFWAWLAARAAGVSVVYNPMEADSTALPVRWLGPAYGHIGKWLDTLVDHYVVFSDYYYNEYAIRKGVAGAKITLNPLPVDTERFAFRERPDAAYMEQLGVGCRRPVVGMASRLYAEKGVDVAIRILRCLKAYHPEAVLVVAGEGPERSVLEELARRLEVSGSVVMLGNRCDMPKVFSSFDIFLTCTVKPNLGLAVLEALSAARPVALVARNNIEREMARDTVSDGLNGLVISDDPEQAASVLADPLGDPERLALWGRESRRLCEQRFSWKAHVYATVKLYQDLLARNGR
jgi:glycosyltransferase involved in cell wall biosynthesis